MHERVHLQAAAAEILDAERIDSETGDSQIQAPLQSIEQLHPRTTRSAITSRVGMIFWLMSLQTRNGSLLGQAAFWSPECILSDGVPATGQMLGRRMAEAPMGLSACASRKKSEYHAEPIVKLHGEQPNLLV